MCTFDTSASNTESASTTNSGHNEVPHIISNEQTGSELDTEFMDDDTIDTIFNGIDVNSATQTYVLAENFHLTHFKDFQKQAVEAALNGKDTLIIQPTGKGKSLCYQFPAAYTGTTTLVITPTISLMQDQTYELNSKGIKAMYLGSSQTDSLAEIKAFNEDNPVPILFVSPEWMIGKQTRFSSL